MQEHCKVSHEAKKSIAYALFVTLLFVVGIVVGSRNLSHFLSNLTFLVKRVFKMIGGNSFIFKRGFERWLAHWLIMWGCIIAAAITFPLAFGWIYFLVPDGDFSSYNIVLFGFPTLDFKLETTLADLLFHPTSLSIEIGPPF